MKKGILILSFLFLLSSCGSKPKPVIHDNLVKKEITLVNKSEEYTIKDKTITTYYYENGSVPMIGVSELISSLDGFFLSEKLQKTVDLTNEKIKYYRNIENEEVYFDVDCKNDIIKVNDMSFFHFIDEPTGIDYDKHYEYITSYSHEGQEIVFNLKNYGVDIFIEDNDIILPLNFLNTLFLMDNISNLIFNGKDYFFFSNYLEDPEAIYEMRNKELEGKNLASDFIEMRNNGLYFILDYFYGLKDVKNISSFKELITSNERINTLLNSKKTKDSERALVKLLVTYLDDPHTSVGYSSIYTKKYTQNDIFNRFYFEDYGPRTTDIFDTMQYLDDLYSSSFPYGDNKKYLRIDRNTAYIKFDSFMVGYDDEIYDSNGKVKDDAYLYDTYYLLLKAFNEINDNKNIENVVIDLSTNGGGVISACYSALGFLTNENIKAPMRDTLTKEEYVEEFRIDSDDDGDFDDDDAFTNYNYYILTSNSTFSAANYFTSICKDMGLATIIGQKSGGGMCGVGETTLLDGSSISFSSTFALSGIEYDNEGDFILNDIEFGINVDKEIPYNRFYNLTYLTDAINLNFNN